MAEHGSSDDRHIHIIKGKGLDSLVEELARLMWNSHKAEVMQTLADTVPAIAAAGVPASICENLVLFGFKIGIAEVMISMMEGDLQMKEVELPPGDEQVESLEEDQIDGEV